MTPFDRNSLINENDDIKDLYLDWLKRLRDQQAKVTVIRHVNRIEQGNFGGRGFCREGVWELRIDVGPDYRVVTP